MNIYAWYQPELADMVRVWERSWRLRGWNPRLLSGRKSDKGKLVVSLTTINFGLARPRKLPPSVVAKKFGNHGWQTSKLVMFPNAREDEVLNCGRALC